MSRVIPDDLAEKAALMREYVRRLDVGEPVSDQLYAALVSATNDRYATGPKPGQYSPDFALPDQHSDLRCSRMSADRAACFWCFIAAGTGDRTAAPNWSSWNNPV